MPFASDHAERVYAGVLGKLVGVYLGRPFEQWSHERIARELAPIAGYVTGHPALEADRRDSPLVVCDDDVNGTFTFLRAVAEHGGCAPSAAQVGETWRNLIVAGRTGLWWGGVGVSTEETAFANLAAGIDAPTSGSAARNGVALSEQIGGQIFVDGWAMAAPGDPGRAAALARTAASVSHDGEALHAAASVAAMESAAFGRAVSPEALVAVALDVVPGDSEIASVLRAVRGWWREDPGRWQGTLGRVEAAWGDRPGPVHVLPNHAIVVLALLYGGGDLSASLAIACEAGRDTDCNAGVVGCLLGIRGGLAAFAGTVDWRGPVADRLYLSSADGGRAITDAVRETAAIVDTGRALAGLPPAPVPEAGARFHFSLPGSVQGFRGAAVGHAGGCLRVGGGRALTATFIGPESLDAPGYELLACPTLSPGQVVRARVRAQSAGGATVRLVARAYGPDDALHDVPGAVEARASGDGVWLELAWRLPSTGGQPVAEIGIEADGPVLLERLGWDGAPALVLGAPADGGSVWRRAFVDAADAFATDDGRLRIVQREGRGLLIAGTREWSGMTARATVTLEAGAAAGLAVRVHGLRRYVALLVDARGLARVVRVHDGAETELARAQTVAGVGGPIELSLGASGACAGDVRLAADAVPADGPVALVVEAGTASTPALTIAPR